MPAAVANPASSFRFFDRLMCCSFYDNAPGGVASPHWRVGEGMNSTSANISNFRRIAVFKPLLSKLVDRCRLLIELGISDLKDIELDASLSIWVPPIDLWPATI